VEYFDPRRNQGVVYAFRGSTPAEAEHSFVLRGRLPDATYQLRFQDHSSPDRTLSGRELMGSGLRIRLPDPNSSELIFIQQAGSHAARAGRKEKNPS
jgi:hypothetical protein